MHLSKWYLKASFSKADPSPPPRPSCTPRPTEVKCLQNGSLVFPFSASVAYLSLLSLSPLFVKWGFSFVFCFVLIPVNTCIQTQEGRQRSGPLPHSCDAMGPAPGAGPPGWVPWASLLEVISDSTCPCRAAQPPSRCHLEDCREAAQEIPPMTRAWGRKPDGQGGSGFQGFRKAAPGAHLKDDICLSDACFNKLLPNFCDTGRRPSQISFQIRINLEI